MNYVTIIILITLSAINLVCSQFSITYYQEKPGSCPPLLPIQICSRACFVDAHCQDIGKCCPTGCGGAVCSKPVTMKSPEMDKPGLCPEPSGRWICSPTCTIDGDCRGTKKCCKNRCGALACQLPKIESANHEKKNTSMIKPIELPDNEIANHTVNNDNENNIPTVSYRFNPNNPFLFNNNNN